MDKTLKHYFDGQRGNYDDVKKDIRTMQDFQNHQLSLLKLSLDEMAHDLTGMLFLPPRIISLNDIFFEILLLWPWKALVVKSIRGKVAWALNHQVLNERAYLAPSF